MTAVDEARWLLRMRQSHGRQPRFFYVAPDMEVNLLTEASMMNRFMSRDACNRWPRSMELYGLPVLVRRDFPAGFMLASETELH